MKERMLAALARFDPRLLLGLMILIAGLAAFEGWMLLLRAPLAEYQKLSSTRESLALSLAAAPSQQGELARLAAELRQVSARLTGQLQPPAPDDQIASLVMAELDRSAGQNGITLAGIRPGPRREVLGFEETSFEVSAQGNYLRVSCRTSFARPGRSPFPCPASAPAPAARCWASRKPRSRSAPRATTSG